MKKRLLNRCKNCGHTWFPRGFDLSRKCPNCDGVDVDVTGAFYLVILGVIAVAAGIFWATDRPHKAPHVAAATPTGTPVFMKPRHGAHAAPDAFTLPVLVIKTEAEGRREALRLFPDLGTANSPLNTEFVARYNSYQRLAPEFFQNPAWPVVLAKESAAAVAGQRNGR